MLAYVAHDGRLSRVAAGEDFVKIFCSVLTRQLRLLLRDDKNKLILDWSAKAGCTIAVKMFLRQMGLLDDAQKYSSWVHNYREQVFYKKYGFVKLADVKNNEYKILKVVRNPYVRAVSSYVHHCRTGFLDKAIRRAGLNKVYLSCDKISFRGFLLLLSKFNLDATDVHVNRQKKLYEKISYGAPIVCKLEHMAEHIDDVNKRFNLNFDLSGLSSHHHVVKTMSNDSFVADIPWEKLKSCVPEYGFFYDKDTYLRVSELYQSDLNSYDYEFPWPEMLDK